MKKLRSEKYRTLGVGVIIFSFICSLYSESINSSGKKLLLYDSFLRGKSTVENFRMIKKIQIEKKYLLGNETIIYPFNKYFNYKEGTVEFSILFTSYKEIKNKKDWTIFWAAANSTGFANSIIFIRGWGNGIFLLVGDKKGKRTIIPYPAMMSSWKINEWHQVAFSWKLNGVNKEIALYIDGILTKKLRNVLIEMDDKKWEKAYSVSPDLNDWNSFKDHVFSFGASWGSKGTKDAHLGNLKIYNYVRSYSKEN